MKIKILLALCMVALSGNLLAHETLPIGIDCCVPTPYGDGGCGNQPICPDLR